MRATYCKIRRASQLRSRCSTGTSYTDITFAYLTTWADANTCQVFIHWTISYLRIEVLRSKKAVPSAIKNHTCKYYIPNHHRHSDRAPKFLRGAALYHYLDQATCETTQYLRMYSHVNSRHSSNQSTCIFMFMYSSDPWFRWKLCAHRRRWIMHICNRPIVYVCFSQWCRISSWQWIGPHVRYCTTTWHVYSQRRYGFVA